MAGQRYDHGGCTRTKKRFFMDLKFPAPLTQPGSSYWLYLLKATLAIEVPNWLLTGLLLGGQAAGWLRPSVRPDLFSEWSLASFLLVGAILETLVVCLMASLIARWFTKPLVAAGISGVGWGALHASDLGLSFICPSWAFFVMTLAYLVWRPKSFWLGYLAAVVPHFVHDIQWKIFA